jgi:hypothetical protein
MQKPGQKSAIISSTAIDLPEHRKQVAEACLCMGIFPLVMESLPARDADAIRVSMEMVDKADLYIGIFAWRYGHIPEGQKISITEMEFDRAVRRKIPILVFLTHKEHPLLIDQVECSQESQSSLVALKERACKDRGRREFKSPDDLRAHVTQALASLIRDEWKVGSPPDAIQTEEARLQQLDPRFSVSVTATSKSMDVQIEPIVPIMNLPKIEFVAENRKDDLKAFAERGQPFKIKATEIQISDSPIHTDILHQLGNAEITFTGLTFDGCMQFHFYETGIPACAQVDGEWTLAPKQFSFNGQLKDSPMKVFCVRERGDDGKFITFQNAFKFDWGAWEGQALLALSFLDELEAILRSKELMLRCYIRGHEEWPPEKLVLAGPQVGDALDAVEWIQSCKRIARQIGANPPFPAKASIHEIESTDVRLLVKLIEQGKHEQPNAGEIVEITGEEFRDDKGVLSDIKIVTHIEPVRVLSFFGISVPIGPLYHSWTDVEVIETKPIGNGRISLMFKGKATSNYRVEFKLQPEG